MSDATSSDTPIPRVPLSPATEPASPVRSRKRDTILFATTALVVAGMTAGVIMRHRIEPLVHPMIVRFLDHHPGLKAGLVSAYPGSAGSRIVPLSASDHQAAVLVVPDRQDQVDHGVASQTKATSAVPDDHATMASAATLNGLVALQPGPLTTPWGDQSSAANALPAKGEINLIVGVPNTAVRTSSDLPLLANAQVEPPVSPAAKGSVSKAPMSKAPLAKSDAAASVIAVQPVKTTAASEPKNPVIKPAASAMAVSGSTAVNALLHPPIPHAKPVWTIPPVASHIDAMPKTGSGPATLTTIAHPVETARNLVAGPLTPKSEIPVLSLVSQLGVLVAQLRDQNLALTRQVATMRTTMDRRLDEFGRTLNLDQAKSALALVVHPVAAPRAAIHPQIFQSHSAIPAGHISPSRYRIEAASPGLAVLSHDGHTDEVSVGDAVPGVGRVLAVTEDGTTWVVRTTHGVIR